RRQYAGTRVRLRLRGRPAHPRHRAGRVEAPPARRRDARRRDRDLRRRPPRRARERGDDGERMTEEPLRQALREANAELLRRIEELSLIRLVGDALAGAVEPAAIGTGLVALLRSELQVDAAALWAVDELAGGVRLVALVSGDQPAARAAAAAAPPVPFPP